MHAQVNPQTSPRRLQTTVAATLFVTLSALLTAPASAGDLSDRAGWSATLPFGQHGAQALVTIIDEQTLWVEALGYFNTGGDVAFRLGVSDDEADYALGLELPPVLDEPYGNDTLALHLPDGETLAGFSAIAIWSDANGESYTSGAFAPPVVPGDLNCDGWTDFGDINPFVLALTDPNGYPLEYPGCDPNRGDLDGSGATGFGDINPFVDLLLAGPSASAEYELIFDSTWSPETHPTNFPVNEHYSGLIGGTHNDQVHFWREGEIASDGIEWMAELGGTSKLTNEVQAAITAGNAGSVVTGPSLPTSPLAVSTTFTATQAFSHITITTMIAPSPDWFIGLDSEPLFVGGDWIRSHAIQVQPMDAGTDSGVTYGSPNLDTQPREPIYEITGFPFDVGGEVAPMGSIILRRID